MGQLLSHLGKVVLFKMMVSNDPTETMTAATARMREKQLRYDERQEELSVPME